MTATPRRIDALDVPEATLLERLRLSLPLTDPDRHDLDTVADARFAALAPGRPDLAASREAGYEEKVFDWGPAPERTAPVGYSGVGCEPEFSQKLRRTVATVETGGVL